MLFYQLTRAFAYRQIRDPQMKWYKTILPAFLSAFFCAYLAILPVQPPLFANGGITQQVLSVFVTLPGFFIAALAAVATFSKPSMDDLMPTPAPTVRMSNHGIKEDIPLTTRMFLTFLFSYLTALSGIACLLCIFGYAVAPNFIYLVKLIPKENMQHVLLVGGKLLYELSLSLIISSIIITTLHGMYFLSERMHQTDPNTSMEE